MIQIKNIVKNYLSGENEVHALRDVSINFRNNEFVSILGPSGCGKTTMLNIIGGLDKYTSGDLIINDVSTKKFKDKDWDAYRNHSVGFVFQSYNLIPHQTVLQNVEIALTISGVSKSERKSRAIKALEEVGLGDQIKKKPNALSGGQMQRVAIARALVNNPEIILADEPTGALDTETSVQVMEILKKVAQDRLVVMVTHNPELAEKYSTRIINMLDGKIINDTKPYTDLGFKREQNKLMREANPSENKGSDEEKDAENAGAIVLDKEASADCKKVKTKKEKKPSMSFWTAFKLSLKNLFTKKGRTALTSFAGSIGIIGIALILAVSQGTTTYINHVQESTLASYPITLEETTIDMTSLLTSFMNVGNGELTHDRDAVYKDPVIGEMVNALTSVESSVNDLKSFKAYLETEMAKEGTDLNKAVTGVQYSYDLELDIYTKNIDNEIVKSDTNELMADMIGSYMMSMSNKNDKNENSDNSSMNAMMDMEMSMMGMNLWQEILPGMGDALINNLVYEQYELVDGGSWPNEYDEIVLIVNENNEVDDLTLYALGLIGQEEIDAIIDAASNGTPLETTDKKWSYDEIKERTFKTILPADSFVYSESLGIYVDVSELAKSDPSWMATIYEKSALELKITGIVRPKENADASLLSLGIGYTSKLTEYVINKSVASGVVEAQKASPTIDVLTGKPFESNTGNLSDSEKVNAFEDYVSKLSDKKKAETYVAIKCLLTDVELAQKTAAYMAQNCSTREIQEAMIINAVASQMELEPEAIAGYFKDMTDEQVYGVAFALCQEIVKATHEATIKASYPMSTEEQVTQLANELDTLLSSVTTVDFVTYYDKVTEFSENTYEEVLVKLGCLDLDSPKTISLYVSSFEDKDLIKGAIDEYNKNVPEEKQITYVDYLGLMMSSITTIINAITYVLIAFVAISLIVSSIMIGVITLISVQERTKEIGILRAIGASKRDVSSMFNAETLIIGFSSGLLGVVVTYLLCIPINIILFALTGLANLKAILPVSAAIILVLISMGLTLISGLIPSRSAAKKDPVIALRTE